MQAYPAFASLQRVYSIARAALPDSIASFLPTPKSAIVVPLVPTQGFPTLTPKELKDALISLATPEKLTMVPDDTPNLLIFNNATAKI